MTKQNPVGLFRERRKAIEARARHLLLSLWNEQGKLKTAVTPLVPMDVVSPGAALEFLGYTVSANDLGQDFIDGQLIEVAGLIDFDRHEVRLSTKITKEEAFFTAAHELGHAVLHEGRGGLHRDRPLRGPSARRDWREVEADYFASCFLMPEKELRRKFKEKFVVDCFELTDATAFALCATSVEASRARIKSERHLSRLLAECVRYDARDVHSLKQEFEVSTEAMAIRLEELRLVSL